MSTFADYTFYTQHGGQLSEAVYNAAVDDAHAEILSQTNGAAQTAPEVMQEAVKLCECKLVDAIAAYKDAAALLPKGVGSISNDGYSVSMGTGSASPLKAEAQERAAICARYLQWPVNLMCRWL
ncbi:hypothetical protein LJC34_02720 [Oscillospiraceae bacterium OttesenSCG-928-G22]|nr:hypothetical protein [Oscillospiraceae bacterium OttesenSCG-928-G22]